MLRALLVVAALAAGCSTTSSLPSAGCGSVAPLAEPLRAKRTASSVPGPRNKDIEVALATAAVLPTLNDGMHGGTLVIRRFVSDHVATGVRQILAYTETQTAQSYASSVLRAEYWPFQSWEIQPFLGVDLGFGYGESINETLVMGGHGGLRVGFPRGGFVVLEVGYEYFGTKTEDDTEIFDTGAGMASLGFGVTF